MKTNIHFFIISCSVLRMRNVSDKSCREIQNTQFMFNDFLVENRAVYDIMWKKYGTARWVTQRQCNAAKKMRFACWDK